MEMWASKSIVQTFVNGVLYLRHKGGDCFSNQAGMTDFQISNNDIECMWELFFPKFIGFNLLDNGIWDS